jgi:hypothetical protein
VPFFLDPFSGVASPIVADANNGGNYHNPAADSASSRNSLTPTYFQAAAPGALGASGQAADFSNISSNNYYNDNANDDNNNNNNNIVTTPFILPPVACIPSYRNLFDPNQSSGSQLPPASSFLTFGSDSAAVQDRFQNQQGPQGPQLLNRPSEVGSNPHPFSVAPPLAPAASRINRIGSVPSIHNLHPRYCHPLANSNLAQSTTHANSRSPPADFPTSVASVSSTSGGRNPAADDYVWALANGDFSSPSTYPPLVSSPAPPLPSPSQATVLPLLHSRPAGDIMPRQTREPTAASTRSRRSSRSSVVDLTKEERGSASPHLTPSPMAPPPFSRRRPRHTPTPAPPSVPTRRRLSAVLARPAPPKRKHISIDDSSDGSLFGDSSLVGKDEEAEVLDFTKPDEHEEKPKVDSRIKLSGFQCVICMDDATALTVTHCGELNLPVSPVSPVFPFSSTVHLSTRTRSSC